MSIPCYIAASDKNKFLIDGCKHYLKKHIPEVDIGIIINATPDWGGGMINALQYEQYKHEWFLLMLEDYWVQSVDHGVLSDACATMNHDNTTHKIDLSGDRMNFPHEERSMIWVESSQTAKYRSSLQAALWRRDYFLSLCEKGMSAWDFEIKGGQKAMNDGACILGVRTPCIKYVNILRKGEWYGRFDF